MTQPIFIHSAHVQTKMRYLMPRARGKITLTVRYGLLEHPQYGLILMDTGYIDEHITAPHYIFLKLYYMLLRPKPIAAGQIDVALARYGYTKDDVNIILLSHFHVDHMAALQVFPNAKFLCSQQAYTHLLAQSSWVNMRHGHFLSLLPKDFIQRLEFFENSPLSTSSHGLESYDILGDQTVMALKLSGHTLGHFGFYFPQLAQPLLYAADAHWLKAAITSDNPFSLLAKFIMHDERAAMDSLALIAHFQQHIGVVVLCHDPIMTQYDEVL